MTQELLLSVVIPLFNEEDVLWTTVEDLTSKLDELVGPRQWQLIPVDNGSTDSTPDILNRIANRWPNTLPLHLDRPNIGAAMRAGLEAGQGNWACIMPVEEGDIEFFAWAWQYREHYDLILGSKLADPTLNYQSQYRRFLSWGLNSLLRLLCEYVGADTHGAKLLYMESMQPILDRCVMSRGQFDTELTLRAVRAGLRVAEVPVIYKEKRPHRNLMVTKILRNVYDLLCLSRAMKSEPYDRSVRFHRWSRHEVTSMSLPSSDQPARNIDRA